MQTAEEYIAAISDRWPKWPKKEASTELLQLSDEAAKAFPESAKLWCMRGDLIQLSGLEAEFDFPEALASYRQALLADPDCAEAHESIGYYFDVMDVDLPNSEAAFRRAVELEAGEDSHYGLTRVLAEQGKIEEALWSIEAERCPFHNAPEINELRQEIQNGNWSP